MSEYTYMAFTLLTASSRMSVNRPSSSRPAGRVPSRSVKMIRSPSGAREVCAFGVEWPGPRTSSSARLSTVTPRAGNFDARAEIVSELAQTDGVGAVKARTLDDRSTLQPNVEVWCVDRQPWVTLPNMAVSLERE